VGRPGGSPAAGRQHHRQRRLAAPARPQRAAHRCRATLAEKLLLLHAGRYDPPWVRDLAADTGTGEEAVRQLLRKLARQGQLFQVVKDLFYSAARMDELAALVQQLAARPPTARSKPAPSATPPAWAASAPSRSRILRPPGYTRRVRDAHVLRPDAQWNRSR
jgi:selenocysteine-specific elongation factor